MNKEKVESANRLYLLIGILYLISFIVCIYMTNDIIHNLQSYFISFILIFALSIMIIMSFLLLIAYITRKEFYIYNLKLKENINFNKINKEFIQIKRIQDKLYYIKKKDRISYIFYKLVHKGNY